MTPEQVRAFFDVNAVAIMFAFGMLWKYVPALDKLWNWAIPWINAVAYIVLKLVGPTDAHAADGAAIASGVGVIVGGLTNSWWAALLYDKMIKPVIEKFFGRHKSDIRNDRERGLTVNATRAAEPS